MPNSVIVGNSPLKLPAKPVAGSFIEIEGQSYYKISNYDSMRPFFMSLVSHSDHWLFISSSGGLSAGRRSDQTALFPYYTDDKISADFENTGSKSILRVVQGDKKFLWEPFSNRYPGAYSLERNLFKSVEGNRLIFEEINHDLNIQFRYSWSFSEKYGFIKRSSLQNLGSSGTNIEVLDGIQNILPYGLNPGLQNERSNLTKAYRKNELEPSSGMGLFMLSSIIVDRAEPSEALKTTTVWSMGLNPDYHLLSSVQLDTFRRGDNPVNEQDIKAEQGAYFLGGSVELEVGASKSWYIVSEINQDHTAVINLITTLEKKGDSIVQAIDEEILVGTKELRRLVGLSDGIQLTNDKLTNTRHYSNVLFNIMRGGLFEDQYEIDLEDLKTYLRRANRLVWGKYEDFIGSMEPKLSYHDLLAKCQEKNDADLSRLCLEYLPLSFSRRHGDPSRPWNKFIIDIQTEEGEKNRYYEGNWRDIFQNWEALGRSYPNYISGMITRFVNASTMDGYNPYRITKHGLDWEIIEPDDPWSYIGYWGDHQIIYLLKLLELAYTHDSKNLNALLNGRLFVYADVPYKIKPYQEILNNSKDTILFDQEHHENLMNNFAQVGSDGKLRLGKGDTFVRANLMEKLLLTLLVKMANLVPGAGIWLNTQRPEWNDANNALVGNGTSMVTLFYMQRYVDFMMKLLKENDENSYKFNTAISEFFKGVNTILESHKPETNGDGSSSKKFVDEMGTLSTTYREKIYEDLDHKIIEISSEQILKFLELAQVHLSENTKQNLRTDGLYHSYNLVDFSSEKLEVTNLYEMVEGQVAVISSGKLTAEKTLAVLDALKSSKIFRDDQFSYLLYPNRELPRFLDKNNIPESFIDYSRLAFNLLNSSDESIISKDKKGGYHFNGSFNNAESLKEALLALEGPEIQSLVQMELDSYLEVFEKMFDHRSFTGRSGTFYGYEGLGSIYWHMVSKLLLAIGEVLSREENIADDIKGKLVDHYYEIRAGIGINKSPELYGAFPTDPYSHTPGNKGAQQPGMTGQVKEDILSRWYELGIQVSETQIRFNPTFLNQQEFLTNTERFEFFSLSGEIKSLDVKAGELAFTYCQVPIIYRKSSSHKLIIKSGDTFKEVEGDTVSKDDSQSIFSRSGEIDQIIVEMT